MPSIPLRDYQQEALNAIVLESLQGVNRQLIALPTGSGKTIVMAALALHLNKKTLILAHREELIAQAVEKFKLVWPGVGIGVCMAERDDIHEQVVVGSIQSCSRPKRIERLKEKGFDLMMIDEAHHSAADSYQSIIAELGFVKGGDKLLVGVTATPNRSDHLGLGTTFDKITFSRSISTMIKAGYLAPVVGRKILTNFSLSGIRSFGGDFSISDLAEAVNSNERNNFIASKFLEYAAERKGIAFCCDVQHCKDLAAALKRLGIASDPVWGDMGHDDRKNTLEAFKDGRIQVLTSCGILTEGYDEPSVTAIIMARPTKSSGLYTQCVGRGLRLWPGKENCLVLDFSDTHNNLDSIMTLASTIPESIELKETIPVIDGEEIDRRPKIEVLQDRDELFDILGAARFLWVKVGDEWSLQDDERNEVVMHPANGGYVASLYGPDGSSRQIVKTPIPLEYCSGVCEDYARLHLKVAFAEANSPWMSANIPPTQSQIDYLKKKEAYSNGMTRSQANIEIRKIVAKKNQNRRATASEPITINQDYFLRGRNIDTTNMTKWQAMQAIGKIKQEESVRYG